MKFSFWFNSLWLCTLLITRSDQKNYSLFHNNLIYSKDGNITIVGIFGNFNDDNCIIEDSKTLQEIASTIWTIEALNYYNYLHGINIGLKIFNFCGNITQLDEIYSVLNEGTNKDNNNIGFLTSPQTFKIISSNPDFSKKAMQIQQIIDKNILVDLTVQLLSNLQWMIVDQVITDDINTKNLFKKLTSDENICILNETVINKNVESNILKNEEKEWVLVVVIAEFANILVALERIQSHIKLILVPTDFTFDMTSVELPKDTMILLPSTEPKEVLFEYIQNAINEKDFFNPRRSIKSSLFMGVAGSVLRLLKPYKRAQDDHCKDINLNLKQPCAKVVDFIDASKENKMFLQPKKSTKISPDEIANALQVLKIDSSSNDEMFLYLTLLMNANSSDDLAIFQIYNSKTKKVDPILLMIKDGLLSDRDTKNKSEINVECKDRNFEKGLEWNEEFRKQKQDSLIKLLQSLATRSIGNHKKENNQSENVTFTGTPIKEPCDTNGDPKDVYRECQNFGTKASHGNDTKESYPAVVWCFMTWVSVNTSVGFVGVMCTLCIMLFIMSRICKGDILEGSPYFTIFLMISAIIAFFNSFLFHFTMPHSHNLICLLRETGPPVSYAFIFSLLLSRGLMLASSESDGFVSHINGYLQTILFCFMFGIQISLTSQNFIFKRHFDCSDIHDRHYVMISLSYNFILLTFLACISPFIIRSKRNYKEGLLFSITVFFIIAIWSAWISFYFLLPDKFNSATIAVGLNSTACALLICIFIPRTYLMAAAIVRDRTTRSLPTLDRNLLTQVIDNNYKSNQALNESVFGTITYRSCEMGLNNPEFSPGSDLVVNSNNSLN